MLSPKVVFSSIATVPRPSSLASGGSQASRFSVLNWQEGHFHAPVNMEYVFDIKTDSPPNMSGAKIQKNALVAPPAAPLV